MFNLNKSDHIRKLMVLDQIYIQLNDLYHMIFKYHQFINIYLKY